MRTLIALVVFLAPTGFAADAYFEVAAPPEQRTFVIRVATPAAIAAARAALAGDADSPKRVMGRVARAPAFYNQNWSYHLDPGSIAMFDVAAEVCDAAPSEVEAHLAEVGGAFLPGSTWCPWSSVLVRELEAPANEAEFITNVSAADYSGLALAPGSIVSAFGTGLAEGESSADSFPLPETLGGVSVNVTDSQGTERAAGLFYVSPQQVNYAIPDSVAAGLATVTITTAGGAAVTEQIFIQAAAPSLFTLGSAPNGAGAGWVFRVRGDGTSGYEAITQHDGTPIPIDLGPETDRVYLSLLGTGLRGRASLDAVGISFGDTAAAAMYVGPQPETPGLDQVNVELPRELAGRGEIRIVITIQDGERKLDSNAVLIAVQ